ncbi:MAG: hypothetical protein ACKVUT_01795 [Gaiella sp.]
MSETKHESHSLNDLLLAGVGWASMGVEAAERLADDLAGRLGIDRGQVRSAVTDTLASWRHESEKLGGRRGELGEQALNRLGLVRREELEDLQLRVAQLEHRLRLVERDTAAE